VVGSRSSRAAIVPAAVPLSSGFFISDRLIANLLIFLIPVGVWGAMEQPTDLSCFSLKYVHEMEMRLTCPEQSLRIEAGVLS
jgi:hypothetical protein